MFIALLYGILYTVYTYIWIWLCMLFIVSDLVKIDKLTEEKPIEYLITYRGIGDETNSVCR
jgi:hypothetical protein